MTKVRAWLKRWSLWIVIVVAAAFLGGRGQIEAEKLEDTVEDIAVLSKENRHLVKSLQSAIVQSCTENGNAARKVARESLQEELHEAEHPDPAIIEALDIPPALLERITQKNIKKLHSRLARVHAVNCAAQYQISPDDRYGRRDSADSSTP